jgi:NDP-sugar pyrophosphorylase family protein
MVLRSKDGPLQVAFDEASGCVRDIGRRLDAASESRFLFTGIYLVNPEFLARIPAGQKLSVIPIFLEMIRTGAPLGGIVIDDGHWWDLGSREQYLAVHRHFAETAASEELSTSNSQLSTSTGAPWLAPTARISPTAELAGATAIGPDATIGAGARLCDCIVWNGAEVASGADLTACVVTDGAQVAGEYAQSDL